VKAITARGAGPGSVQGIRLQGGGHGPARPPRWIVGAARLLLGVFFRAVEVVGEERIPRGRPLVVVANHVNGLVDPLLVLGALPLTPRFLAKSTLWKIPVLARLLDLARALPVYRRQDEPAGPGSPEAPAGARAAGKPARQRRRLINEETFARCYEELARGGAIALFPEGTSHNQPGLQPLKTGAARIALGAEGAMSAEAAEAAEAHRPAPDHPFEVAILTVGLNFDARGRFR